MRLLAYVVIALLVAPLVLVVTGHQDFIVAAMDGFGMVLLGLARGLGMFMLLVVGICLLVAT